MEEVTGVTPVMWGTGIVGIGNNHYVYASGREGDTPAVSFAARKNKITLYGVIFYLENKENVDLAKQLGPHTHGKGCLYIKTLDGINLAILKKMIKNAYLVRSDKKYECKNNFKSINNEKRNNFQQ